MSGGQMLDDFTVYSDIWRINLETLQWFKLDYTHKIEIFCVIACVVEDSYLYLVAGVSNGELFGSKLERFDIRYPSLCGLCLESIRPSPNIKSLTKSLPADILDEIKNIENDSSAEDIN
ncbi:hypothetical protein RF11_10737 [Thelohanellus kitauei]|uniref:Kelch domain-containing protein 10 n=1 Tax=Thelohanellus kitauei TaxID=669202 RepID=A0A0C2J3C1_THEKT|nr:hypothetical protein RF11_10737 [Thelohanellus kitauei]